MAAAESLTDLVQHLRRRCGPGATDGELLSRFAANRDEAAFAELVDRHGRLVLGVARRHLPDRQSAEDVVQTTFAALAQRAGRLGRPPSLVNWLYTVALRHARTARIRFARQRAILTRLPLPTEAHDPLNEVSGRELVTIIDDELERLPERYRLPLVLCALEGLSRDEAAVHLGWTLGSFRGRLERGRELLRKRLSARGLTVPAVLAGGLLATPVEAMPAALVRTVVRAAVAMPPAAMPVKLLVVAVVVLTTLGVGTGVALMPGGQPQPKTGPPAAAIPPPPHQQAVGVADPTDPKFAGRFSGRVMGPDGKPLSGARVFIAPKSKDINEIGRVRATTDADGRFEFDAPDMTYAELDGLPARREGLLIVTKDGYAPDWFETWGQNHGGLLEYWDPVKGAPLDLQLAKDDVPIHGRFLDPDGGPLAGARVRINQLMIPRDRDLSAHLDRWSKASVDSGFLTKVPDFKGELYRPNLLPGLTTETKTDGDGRFTLSGLGRDRLAWLSVSAADVVDTNVEVMTRDAADVGTFLDHNGKATGLIHGAGFTLKLKRGATIFGLVRDRASGAPIPGMWATMYLNPLTDPSLTEGVTVSDENGRFAIGGLDPELLNSPNAPRTVTAIPRPGGQYLMALGTIKKGGGVLIECTRGIPFRLKLVDEQGKPVEGNVEYWPIAPNPQIEELIKPLQTSNWPIMDRAARRADSTYEGFVLPGPGAVVVEMLSRRAYRPAHVDPKAFFEPGRTNWPEQSSTIYGTQNTLNWVSGWCDQRGYAAVVLVNPAKGSGPLELSATVVRDRPRQVSLVDADGKPVLGAEMRYEDGYAYQLRAASFPLTGLVPDRVERLTFIQKDRRLIGFVKARGDGATPYTVTMQSWGTVTGGFVDQNGKPLTMSPESGDYPIVTNADPEGSRFADAKVEKNGQFHIAGLVPGQHYSCVKVHRQSGSLTGAAFENLNLRPGEVRDLGDVRVKPSRDETPGAKPRN